MPPRAAFLFVPQIPQITHSAYFRLKSFTSLKVPPPILQHSCYQHLCVTSDSSEIARQVTESLHLNISSEPHIIKTHKINLPRVSHTVLLQQFGQRVQSQKKKKWMALFLPGTIILARQSSEPCFFASLPVSSFTSQTKADPLTYYSFARMILKQPCRILPSSIYNQNLSISSLPQ